MISSLLVKKLKIVSERPVHIIGLAALFHDIGLYGMGPEFQDENEASLTEEQRAKYYSHPIAGAQVLRGVYGIDPSALQAVAQHHERRNKKGFPARAGAGSINRIAEIVGISDEFVRLMKQAKKDPSLDLRAKMDNEVFDGFSHPVVEAFRETFFPKEK
jgi:HD-GYP domain-containing protein (c-di-GMP phosphodiesterase class II)